MVQLGWKLQHKMWLSRVKLLSDQSRTLYITLTLDVTVSQMYKSGETVVFLLSFQIYNNQGKVS